MYQLRNYCVDFLDLKKLKPQEYLLVIGYAIQHDSMDILSFKELLKAYNAGRLSLPEISEQRPEVLCKTGEYRDDDSKLLRDLDYYEQNVGGTVNA